MMSALVWLALAGTPRTFVFPSGYDPEKTYICGTVGQDLVCLTAEDLEAIEKAEEKKLKKEGREVL